MFVLISPAKKQDFDLTTDGFQRGLPVLFESKTDHLVGILKKHSEEELAKVLSVSQQLAKLNHRRFQTFDLNADTKSALFAYQGDVYQYMDPTSWDDVALTNAKNRLLIVSAIYGILRADTQIAPYRLEMINRIADMGSLAKYWADDVTSYVNNLMGEGTILNLASKAYSEVIDRKKLQGQVIDVDFLEEGSDGRLKIIAVNAKRARGLMAKAIMQMSEPNIDALKSLTVRDYRFDEDLSSEQKLVFVKG
jgi:cytoplasmic iron level regulating protein YaaA (DUF328/UPF0246 family)